MIVEHPLITSILDTDWYKITMASVVFHQFPDAGVEYAFINRGGTPFPVDFDLELKHQIELLSNLRLTTEEQTWLNTIPYIRKTYIEWLGSYRFNPHEVSVTQSTRGELGVTVRGPWYRTIFWEVKLMAIISELYFILTNQEKTAGWKLDIHKKTHNLSIHDCYWIDFGTRRRYSYEVQNAVVGIMKGTKGFLGTSNPHLAMKHGVTPQGTYAHESIMAMSALYGVRMANKMWMKHWSDYFGGCLGVALTDTFTTDSFLNDFGSYEARLFDGLRQDSKDEYEWGEKVLAHYRKLGILTSNKRLVFSNNLSPEKYIPISKHFSQWAQPIAGIGTNFTNDCGPKALNMVIKMTRANFGQGWVDVVKLSDENGKHTGKPEAIRIVKEQLGIL
jgi:nicotinate phosphoribosyltransferase